MPEHDKDLEEAKAEVVEQWLREGGPQADQAGIIPRDRDQAPPTTFQQRRLWFLDQMVDELTAYNSPVAARLRGPLNVEALERALRDMAERHEILRTTITTDADGAPIQKVSPAEEFEVPIERRVLTDIPRDERVDEIRRTRLESMNTPFDLEEGPLFRVVLLEFGPEDYGLVRDFHHIIFDKWSDGIFQEELMTLYEARTRDEDPHLDPLPVQYGDYAAWQREAFENGEWDDQLDYWRQKLDGLEPLDLPTDHPRPPTQTYDGAVQNLVLSEALTAEVRRLAEKHNSTPNIILLSAFKALLYRYTGQDSITVGSPVAGRSEPELEPLVGFFVNNLTLRTDLSGNPTFLDLHERVRRTCLEAYDHQDVPFERVVWETRPERDPSRHPLFQVMFFMQNVPKGNATSSGDLEFEGVQPSTAPECKFDMEVVVYDLGDRVRIPIGYDPNLFGEETVEAMARHYRNVLESAVEDPSRPLSDLSILPSDERCRLLRDWATTDEEVPEPSPPTIHERFQTEVQRRPEAIALRYEDETVTYEELNARANRWANHLVDEEDLEPGDPVAVLLEHTPDLLTALLAILKAGGHYVALDPSYPEQRLSYTLEDTDPPLLITCSNLINELSEKRPGRERLVAEDTDWRGSEDPPQVDVPPEHLAYVSYTSGSTGRPKGVMAHHRGVVMHATDPVYAGIDEDDRVLHHSVVSFDASTFEIWTPLLNGATVVLLPPNDGSTGDLPAHYSDHMRKHEVTSTWLTTPVFHLILDHAPEAFETVQQLIVGGESLVPAYVRRLDELHPDCQLINGYGPTECTCFSSYFPVEDPHRYDSSIPIGFPIQGKPVYVLDETMNPTPPGIPGELYVADPQLAHGYLGRPRKTAGHFVPNPFGPEGSRLYRTGDVAGWRRDGILEFHGRTDHQVKIRGHRVEPGEIETQMNDHPAVQRSVVVLHEPNPHHKELVAYYTNQGGEGKPSPTDLREHLEERIPEAVVPTGYQYVETFELTPTGKVDRSSLPEPAPGRATSTEYEPPEGPVERQLAGIWEELLGVDEVGRRDDFFKLGGHSLLATQLVSRIESRFNVSPSLEKVFSDSTLEEVSSTVRALIKAKVEDMDPDEIQRLRGDNGPREVGRG